MTVTDIRDLQAKRGSNTNKTTNKEVKPQESNQISLDVHFDYKVFGENVFYGAVLMDDGETLTSYSKQEPLKEQNNFHRTINAFTFGLDSVTRYVKESGEDVYDIITLFNQNEKVFEWTNTGNFDFSKYGKEVEELFRAFAELQEVIEVGFDYHKVLGPKNEAKKLLEKKTKTLEQGSRRLNPNLKLQQKIMEARNKKKAAAYKNGLANQSLKSN